MKLPHPFSFLFSSSGAGVCRLDPAEWTDGVAENAALLPLSDKSEIRMGFARVDPGRCLRSYTGEDCRLCVSQCPLGAGALAIDNMNLVDVRGDCTGCGVCERACPTDPPAIWVEPNS